MFTRLLIVLCLSVFSLQAEDVTLRLTLVIPDNPETPVNEAVDTLRTLNQWRLTQIIGLTEDGEKILAFNSLKDVLAEELNRYIAAILNDICDTNIEDCPVHLQDDYEDATAAITVRRQRTKNAIRVE